jgi:hypothetical protein
VAEQLTPILDTDLAVRRVTLNGKFEARPGLTIADDMATSETHRAKPIAAAHGIDNHRRNSAPATNYLAGSGVLRGHITNFVELRRNPGLTLLASSMIRSSRLDGLENQ